MSKKIIKQFLEIMLDLPRLHECLDVQCVDCPYVNSHNLCGFVAIKNAIMDMKYQRDKK